MKKHLLCIAFLIVYFQGISQRIADTNFVRGIRYQCLTCLDSENKLTDDARKLTHLTVSILNILTRKTKFLPLLGVELASVFI